MNNVNNYGITVFKCYSWGGISSVIRSEILFYGDMISDRIYDDMKKLNMVIPILMYFFFIENAIFFSRRNVSVISDV